MFNSSQSNALNMYSAGAMKEDDDDDERRVTMTVIIKVMITMTMISMIYKTAEERLESA